MEIWKSINNFKNYKVSNLGRVKGPKGILKPYKESAGYLSCTLYNNHKQKLIRIHRLVAKAFIVNPNNKRTVNHKDTDKTNNKSNNLEWATHKENMEHACKHNLNAKKEKQGLSKLSAKDVRFIRNTYKLGNVSQRSLAKLHNVCQRTITMIVNNITWR